MSSEIAHALPPNSCRNSSAALRAGWMPRAKPSDAKASPCWPPSSDLALMPKIFSDGE